MDFIDDFIREYKNNPCLWKADSMHFKNRGKRQEAYMKLIDVAAKHGEHYNIERTKQKINNLRCAFRHQLRKYVESKCKGEEEPYCPKRRYFESLMFLKDEESVDKKSKQDLLAIKNSESELNLNCPGKILSLDDSLCQDGAIIASAANSSNVRNVNTNVADYNLRPSVATDESSIVTCNIVENGISESEFIISAPENVGCSTTKCQHTKYTDNENKAKSNNAYRKRSSSLSLQIAKEPESVCKKNSKSEIHEIDFEKIVSIACKNIQNNIDDHFTHFGKIVAHKLRTMESTQAIYAEKIIADVLFHGQMKILTTLNVNKFLNQNDSQQD